MTKSTMLACVAGIPLLFACAEPNSYAPPAGQTVTIDENVAEAFAAYQKTVGYTHPGAFAVSESGRSSFYYYCEDTICNQGIVFSRTALERCESHGERCYVFATGHDASYPFRVLN